MGRRVNTYIPAIVTDRRNVTTRPKMVIDNERDPSGTYVKWEDYENLRKEFLELRYRLDKLEK